ncbi:MAG: hypothetical protein NT068_01365 [Candidatus Nomurabacteria bacterium]|nr:hypothetical protein [Candidatus Nomurabacteria bacterium]
MLHIRIKNIAIPFVLTGWKKKDMLTPLKISETDWKVELYILPEIIEKELPPNNQILVHGNIEIYIQKPENWLLDGLNKKSSDETMRTAKYIYEIYIESMRRAVIYARMNLNLQNIFEMNSNFHELFDNSFFSSKKVEWSLKKSTLKIFSFEIPRSNEINPLFKEDKLVSPKKWKGLQKFIDKNILPSKEVEELLRLKQKTAWNEKRIATIESAIIIEFILGKKIQKILIAQGVSQNKIKDIKKDIGMSISLNLLIPLSISKKEYAKQKSYIEKIDKLRKIRNEIIHEGLKESSIELQIVSEGIDSAIQLISFLDIKFP